MRATASLTTSATGPGWIGLVENAMRSRAGRCAAAAVKGITGSGAECASPSAGPRTTSRNRAESITVRDTHPNTDRPYQC